MDLPQLPSVFGRSARTRRTYLGETRPESKESDHSDTSTETIGFRVSYEYIIRHTPLPPPSDEEEVESAGSDYITSVYHEELDEPIWDWEEFYLKDLYELSEPKVQEISDDEMDQQVPIFAGLTSIESVITFFEQMDLYLASKNM